MMAKSKTSSIPLNVRDDFPIFQQTVHDGRALIYLDSAATAQKPFSVIDRMDKFLREEYGTVHRAVYSLATNATDHYHQSRQKARAFLNARYDHEIIFTRGTTASINAIAYSFGKAFIQPGDEVIISELEHHSNIVPWQILCENCGAKLKAIPVNDRGELDLEAYRRLLSDRTKLVAVGHVSNAIGTIHPIKEIIAIAHDAGAKVLIDGAQGAPHLLLDVQELDCDFYCFSGHKIYGPTGVGVLYGKEVLLDRMPPYQGGGDMIKEVTLEKTTYADLPLKFEAGTPSIVEVIGLGSAFDYLDTIGIDHIKANGDMLLEYATQKLAAIDRVRIIGTAEEKSAIISFVVDGAHPLDIGTLLDLKGVATRTGHHCAQPCMRRFGVEATVRASFGVYNTKEDIDVFQSALSAAIAKLV